MVNKESVRTGDIVENNYVFGSGVEKVGVLNQQLIVGEQKTSSNVSKRLKSLFLAGVTVAGVGVLSHTFSESEDKKNTNMVFNTKGEIQSQQSRVDEMLGSKEVIITPREVKETIMNLNIGSVSPEYLSAARDIYKTWEEKTFSPYEEKLRNIEGVKEERVSFCARVWYCRNKAKNSADDVIKFQDYLGEADIIAYVKGEKNANVICDKDGIPRVWIVVADKKFEKKAVDLFNGAIKWYKENKMPDMLESASENGLSVFFVANTHPKKGSSSVWLNEWGEICLNQNSENTKGTADKNLTYQYTSALLVEPFGIKFGQVVNSLNLFDKQPLVYLGNGEVNKSLIASYISGQLSGVDKNGYYENFSENFSGIAKMFATNYARQGVTTDGPLTKKLLELMAEFVSVPGFVSLKEVGVYNEAVTAW